jgi:hypothetical protein
VSFTRHSSISPGQPEDYRGRAEAAHLEKDEHRVSTVHGEKADENPARKPHRPCPGAYSCRAVLAPEVNDLGHLGAY